MTELVFALEFRGRGTAVPGREGRREAHSTATSQTLSTLLTTEGVHAHVFPEHGGRVARISAARTSVR